MIFKDRSLNPVNDGYCRPDTMSKTETSSEAIAEMFSSLDKVGRFFPLCFLSHSI